MSETVVLRGNADPATQPQPASQADPQVTGEAARHPEVVLGRDRKTGKFVGRDGKSEEQIKAELFGTEAPKPAAPEETKGQPAAAAGEKPTAAGAKDSGGGTEGQQDKAFHKAKDWLKRDGFSDAQIDKLGRDDAVELAKARKERVVASQKMQQRIAELEKATATIGKAPEAGSVAGEPRDIPAKEAAEAVKGFRELYGEEAAAALEAALEARIAPLKERLESSIKSYEQSQAERTATYIAKTREGLAGRFPQLEDDDESEEWFGVMKGLYSQFPQRYKAEADFERLGLHATAVLDWTPIEPQPVARNEELSRAVANGTASNGRTRAAPPPALSKEDKIRKGFELALDKKLSVEEARAKLHRD